MLSKSGLDCSIAHGDYGVDFYVITGKRIPAENVYPCGIKKMYRCTCEVNVELLTQSPSKTPRTNSVMCGQPPFRFPIKRIGYDCSWTLDTSLISTPHHTTCDTHGHVQRSRSFALTDVELFFMVSCGARLRELQT